MATHSDGSNSDDTWLFRDGTTIYNHRHKCHRRKARNKDVAEQQVGRRMESERKSARKRQRNTSEQPRENRVGMKRIAIQIVSVLICGEVGYVWLNVPQMMS